MKCPNLIFALTALLSCAACTAKPRVADPHMAGTLGQAATLSDSILAAASDSKEVKRLQTESLSLLERLDYKTTILLERAKLDLNTKLPARSGFPRS